MAETEDSLPLQGVVLCCTSLTPDVRTSISAAATEMGAVHKLDLTSDVTHLLVGSITTPKYRYVAKERPDIKVLSPEFVDKVRESWIEGGEVNVTQFEEECRMPTFAGLTICLTGFEDLAQRKEMEHTCRKEGAEWSADLTKHVTHLITAKPEGAKYTHAKQWGIHTVGLKWYEDSLIRGMAVEESCYRPDLPRSQQGVGAYRLAPRRPAVLGKRGREESQTSAGDDSSRKKLRKSASMRLGGQSQDLWQSFSQHEVQVDHTVLDPWTGANDESQPLRDSIGPHRKRPSDAIEEVQRPDLKEPHELFSGHYVLIHGFDGKRTKHLRQVIETDGATVVNSTIELAASSTHPFFKAQCLLIPHAEPTKLPDVPTETYFVTEWWVERCLHSRKLLDPREDLLSQPLQDLKGSVLQDLAISTTGFDGVDLRMSVETMQLMGARYQEQLLPSTSILICASPTVRREKALYASKHKIPIVSVGWLLDSVKARKKAPLERYQFELPKFDPGHPTPCNSSSPAHADGVQVRGSRYDAVREQDHMQAERLSGIRKRHTTPSLVCKPSRPLGPVKAVARIQAGPFIQDDDDEEEDAIPAPLDDHQPAPHISASHLPLPLREISSNTSQSRTQRGSEHPDNSRTVEKAEAHPSNSVDKAPSPHRRSPSPTKEKSVTEPQNRPSEQKLAHELATIMKGRATSSGQAPPAGPAKRKHRPLGRNLSGTSLTHAHSRASASPALPTSVEQDGDGDPTAVPPPGTQIGYGSPEDEAHRRQMSEKLGSAALMAGDGVVGTRVASMGVVKDSEELSAKTAAAAGLRGGKSRMRVK